MSILVFASLVGIVLAACACPSGGTCDRPEPDQVTTQAGEVPTRTASATPGAQGTVLGHVAFQKHRVTIYSTDDGQRYRLVSDDSGVLAEFMDQAQFRARFPLLYDAFESAQARPLDATHVADPPSGQAPVRQDPPLR